jgi:hypothetical protein
MEPCQGGSRETRSLYLAEAKVFHMAPQVDAQLLTWLVELKAVESADAAPSHASLTTTLERHQVEVIQSGEVRLGCLQPRIAAHVTRIGFRPSSSRAGEAQTREEAAYGAAHAPPAHDAMRRRAVWVQAWPLRGARRAAKLHQAGGAGLRCSRING